MYPTDAIITIYYALWLLSWPLKFHLNLNNVMFKTALVSGLWLSPTIAKQEFDPWVIWLCTTIIGISIILGLRRAKNWVELFIGPKDILEEELEDKESIPNKDLRND